MKYNNSFQSQTQTKEEGLSLFLFNNELEVYVKKEQR